MLDKKYCAGCRNNFYNGNNQYDVKQCWSRKTGKLVWRIRIGNWESPPYLNKKKFRAADCWHAESCGDHYIDPNKISSTGYWK
jgi:hypothetical protein